MRITVDTNILISAAFWTGDSNRIIDMVEEKEIELVLSKEIIEEFMRVLGCEEMQKKIVNKGLIMRRTVEKIVALSNIVEPSMKLDAVKDDPDDNKILECAIAGNADFIVSSDNHLLKLRDFKGMKIITPAEFLKCK